MPSALSASHSGARRIAMPCHAPGVQVHTCIYTYLLPTTYRACECVQLQKGAAAWLLQNRPQPLPRDMIIIIISSSSSSSSRATQSSRVDPTSSWPRPAASRTSRRPREVRGRRTGFEPSSQHPAVDVGRGGGAWLRHHQGAAGQSQALLRMQAACNGPRQKLCSTPCTGSDRKLRITIVTSLLPTPKPA